jgi:diacylglycerol kinase family enzyme
VGGLVRINEGIVDMSDGLFEVILVREPKAVGDLSKILVSLNTGEFNNEMFEFFKSRKITFYTDASVSWSLDGEYQQGAAAVTVENLHNSLRLRH